MGRKLVFVLVILITTLLYAGTPILKTLSSASYTLGAGVKDTITITTFQNTGDSIGIMSEINQDSCSATFSYQYSTPYSYTDATEFASLPVALTVPINAKGGFSSNVPWLAGAYKANIYCVLMNNKSTTQTINLKFYSITWR